MSDSFVTPWTVVHQAPLSMGFPRQEYWSGLPFPSPGDLSNRGLNLPIGRLSGGSVVKNPLANTGDAGSNPGLEDHLEE